MEFFVVFPQKVGDLRQHPDLQMFVAYLPDNPFHHLRVGLKDPCLEFRKLVVLSGVVIDQADDLARVRFVSGNHVERAEGHFFGERPFLQELLGQVRYEDRLQQLIVVDSAVVAHEFRHQ